MIRQIDPGRLELIGINAAKRQRHLGHAKRLALVGAVEYHVRHPRAPERLGRLLPQNPSNSIGNIGLSAAVGPNDRRHTRLKIERRLVCKRLESKRREVLQIHVAANQSQFIQPSKV